MKPDIAWDVRPKFHRTDIDVEDDMLEYERERELETQNDDSCDEDEV